VKFNDVELKIILEEHNHLISSIVYLTDFYYKANGRNYYEEDLYVTSKLKEHSNILLVIPTR
ncbi:MAG TPA: hypothetical protein VM368_00650, partial [Flavisolibacter sp.]|nr:hypothetical protein [Flavisolibacter sp.]